MKKSLSIMVTIIMLFGNIKISAQVKIGDNPTNVNSGSLLELESTNKGLLLPRLADTTSISNPPQGMFMFNNKDTSLYFKRNLGGWQRLSTGYDNYWKASLIDGNNKPTSIFSELPVLVNKPTTGSFLSLAPFQTTGMFGNTLAAFADGVYDNISGISLVGNWPGVYFNSYYDKTIRSMAAGNAGNITMDESNNLGGAFLFKISGNSATANASMPNPPAQMILNNDGKFSLNTGSVPTRAWFEQHGAVNNASAIFGGEGSGVAIEEHFPSIGFNSYYNGSNGYNSIGAGYGGEIGVDQNNGDFYVNIMQGKTNSADNAYSGAIRTFNISPNGFVGINTVTPTGQLQIVGVNDDEQGPIDPANGITLTAISNLPNPPSVGSFNLSTVSALANGTSGQVENSLFISSTSLNNGAFSAVADIDINGNYHQISDARFKKDITSLDQSSMLQKLLLLNAKNYHFINERNDSRKNYGFLAQDVEKVFPEFVNDIHGEKLLAYSSFIPVIVAAVQEQQQEIESLKTQNRTSSPSVQNENNDLKSQVASLTEMVKQLQQQVIALQKQIK